MTSPARPTGPTAGTPGGGSWPRAGPGDEEPIPIGEPDDDEGYVEDDEEDDDDDEDDFDD
jgi:hypothetical protein